jgi:putative tricarboxylic transport membrane protein
MRSWQRWAGGFFLAVAAVALHQSLTVLHLLEAGQPGSGFMPFVLGLLLAVLSLALIVTSRAGDGERVAFWEGRTWLQPLVAVAIVAAFIVVFDDIGAITSVALLVTGWLWLVGKKSFPVALATGIATAAVVWAVFVRLLQTPFPDGLLL